MAVTPYPSRYTAQPLDLTLSALAELDTQPNTAPYFSDIDQAALMTVTPLARSLLDDTTQVQMRQTLGAASATGTVNRILFYDAAGALATDSQLIYDAAQSELLVYKAYFGGEVGIYNNPVSPYALYVGSARSVYFDGAVGIHKTDPLYYLDVGGDARLSGGLLLGNTSDTTNGTIRYSVGDFEGRKAGAWVSLTASIPPTGTANRVAVFGSTGALTSDAELVYDAATNRFGIGLTPAWTFDLTSSQSVGLTTAFFHTARIVQNLQITAELTSPKSYALQVESNFVDNGHEITQLDSAIGGINVVSRFQGTYNIHTAIGVQASVEHAGTGSYNTGVAFNAAAPTITAGGNITQYVGFRADPATVSLVAYYGFRGRVAAASGRYNLYMDGTAQNHLRGNVGIGSGKTVPAESLDTAGGIRLGAAVATNDGTIQYVSGDFQGRKAGAWVSLVGGTLAQQDAASVAITGGEVVLTATDPGAFRVADAGAGTQYGFRGLVNAGTNKYNIFAGGSAPNYFAGNVGIGVTPNASYKALIEFDKGTLHGLVVRQAVNDAGGTYPLMFLSTGNAVIGTISTTSSATSYNTSSDVRLKHAITPLTGALAVVQALKPITHLWRADDSKGYGFRSHEVQETIPDGGIVTGVKDAVDEVGNIIPQMMDNSKLMPWVIAALQEMLTRLELLEKRV